MGAVGAKVGEKLIKIMCYDEVYVKRLNLVILLTSLCFRLPIQAPHENFHFGCVRLMDCSKQCILSSYLSLHFSSLR